MNATVNLTAAKSADLVKLDGISVTFIKGDHDALMAVHLRDAKGNQCRIAKIDYSTMACLVLAPPKIEKRYVMRAELPVVGKIEKAYEHQHDARSAADDVQAIAISPPTVTNEEIEVENVATPGDDIPF